MSDRVMLAESNDDLGIRVYKHKDIIENTDEWVWMIQQSRDAFYNVFPKDSGDGNIIGDSTWDYNLYNMFTVGAGFPKMYDLWSDLSFVIRDFLQTDEQLWTQIWANYHSPSDVLEWHSHVDWTCHGFISIRPQNTVTRFEEFEINNEVGNIYIGPADKLHKVFVLEDYDEPRITCGFDVTNAADFADKRASNDMNLSLIPVR